MYTAAKMLLQLYDSHAPVGALIRKRNESASFSWLDCHFGYHRDS